MLERKEIDLTAGGMLITNGRKPYVDFCIPTAELKGSRVVVRHDNDLHINSNGDIKYGK